MPGLVASGRESGRLSFHTDPAEALPEADLIFVCVGTLNGPEGGVDLSGRARGDGVGPPSMPRPARC